MNIEKAEFLRDFEYHMTDRIIIGSVTPTIHNMNVVINDSRDGVSTLSVSHLMWKKWIKNFTDKYDVVSIFKKVSNAKYTEYLTINELIFCKVL